MTSIKGALQVDLFAQAKADVSTVAPRIDGPVTSFQHSFIVSEQGAAVIWGNDAPEQAEQIINHVAHP
jgi:acyl-CoA hydrolase